MSCIGKTCQYCEQDIVCNISLHNRSICIIPNVMNASQIAKTDESMSIGYWCQPYVSYLYLIDVDPTAFAIWDWCPDVVTLKFVSTRAIRIAMFTIYDLQYCEYLIYNTKPNPTWMYHECTLGINSVKLSINIHGGTHCRFRIMQYRLYLRETFA